MCVCRVDSLFSLLFEYYYYFSFIHFISFFFVCVCTLVWRVWICFLFVIFFLFFFWNSIATDEWVKEQMWWRWGKCSVIFVDVQCKCVWLYMKEIERMDPVKTEFQFKIYRTVVNNPRIRIFFFSAFREMRIGKYNFKCALYSFWIPWCKQLIQKAVKLFENEPNKKKKCFILPHH